MSGDLQIVITCATQVGTREVNEDSYIALSGTSAPAGTLALLAVADGIGGRGTGASASSAALRSLADVFSASCSIANKTQHDTPHLLRFALQKANASVFQMQASDESLKGMGTTCVAAAVTPHALHVVWIGDSRAYIYRDGTLTQLTQDEWEKREDGVTMVNRAIGWQPVLPTEPVTHDIQAGDQLLLCSDGLTDALTEAQICEALESSKNTNACIALSKTAASTPGADNVTVVIAQVVRVN